MLFVVFAMCQFLGRNAEFVNTNILYENHLRPENIQTEIIHNFLRTNNHFHLKIGTILWIRFFPFCFSSILISECHDRAIESSHKQFALISWIQLREQQWYEHKNEKKFPIQISSFRRLRGVRIKNIFRPH